MPSRPQFLVGTASWTDPTLVKSDVLYPPSLKTAEERLRFYAAQFNTVEVDASYYALISERNAELWAERTPPGFIFQCQGVRDADAASGGHGPASGRAEINAAGGPARGAPLAPSAARGAGYGLRDVLERAWTAARGR